MDSDSIQSCCRLCFSTKDDCTINIFSNNPTGLNVATTIEKYFAFRGDEQDLLPSHVCEDCWTKTKSFHEFHESVVSATENFLKCLRKSDINETEDECRNGSNLQKDLPMIETDIDIDEKPVSFQSSDDEMSSHTNNDRAENDERSREAEDVDMAVAEEDSESLCEDEQNKEVSNMPDYFDMTCDMCTEVFDSLKSAKTHYLAEHAVAAGYIKCCKSKLKSLTSIAEHIKWHSNPNLFRCEICDQSFKTKKLLANHAATHKKKFVCKVCKKAFSTQTYLIEHQFNHNVEPELQCDICKIKFFKESVLKKHKLEMHRDDPSRLLDEIAIADYFDMYCDECDMKFNSFKHAQLHYSDVHKQIGHIKCNGCAIKLFSLQDIKDHTQFHLDPNCFRCETCEISFVTKAKLRQHSLRHKNRFQCKICGKNYTQKLPLIYHVSKVHDSDENLKFQCEVCHKKFPMKSMLNHHTKDAHSAGARQMFVCEYCARQFNSKAQLNIHLKLHRDTESPSKPIEKSKCSVCGSHVKKMKDHMLVHTDPVKCTECDVTLASQLSYRSHFYKFHKNGGANHQCHLCTKSFRNASDLQDHINVHTQERKHKCPYCDKTFIWRTEVYKHLKKSHPTQSNADKLKTLPTRTMTTNRS